MIPRQTQRVVTPFGAVAVLLAFLTKIGLIGQLRAHMPIRWRSPNQIDPTATFPTFLMPVLVGAKRFAHAGLLHGRRALHALVGLDRAPTGDTIRNLFHRFCMGQVQNLIAPLAEWQMPRLPRHDDGYTLELDSTVFQRYGKQEGSFKGHHTRKHGRPRHHPLLAVLGKAHLLLHGWLRGGGPRGRPESSRRAEEFVKEALALWGQRQKIRLLRAGSGLFDERLLRFLEQRRLPYILVARLTKWVKPADQDVAQWSALDDYFTLGGFRLKLLGWDVERRFVVVREQLRKDRESVARRLIDVPGSTFRLLVSSSTEPPADIWRGYNRRADMENRIAELKHDLGADGSCRKQFHLTEAAFRALFLLFNLLSEFPRAAPRAATASRPPFELRS